MGPLYGVVVTVLAAENSSFGLVSLSVDLTLFQNDGRTAQAAFLMEP